ncbi:MAG: hypothetical protein LBC88_09365, partial [Spirochaetaceae bacterium]|jgi:hypothetical protein|nr:hypothetical protein [Spirochaetaceae bacterium]
MKKRSVVLFGLLAALLAFGMVLTGCSGDSDTDLFKGTWKPDEGGPTIVITGGEFTMSMQGEDDTLLPMAKGTVAASGNTAVLTMTHINLVFCNYHIYE